MPSGITDLHVHSGPSLAPRHHYDREMADEVRSAGVSRFVLKAHEGSTAERARLIGAGAIGGIVLNSPVGGANPSAVQVAADLGARVVWLPTLSSPQHRMAADSVELRAHGGSTFSAVEVCDETGHLRPHWLEVLDVIAAFDMLLASGHIPVETALVLFRAAHTLGVRRFLVNHPMLPFLGWREEFVAPLLELDARVEVGCLADHLSPPDLPATRRLLADYPPSLMVFGSDLGHSMFPMYMEGLSQWFGDVASLFSDSSLERIMTTNGSDLVGP
jgi:hypothetical protein